ncbi:MAG: MATE family efflux transporter [Deltaproteobacteria bacterium]|nr:MATE family efflux transporter [Deltaproteobacteria bacterium]
MIDRDHVLEGDAPLATRLLRIALPLALAASVRYLVELSGVYWTGKLGVSAIAVVSALSYVLAFMRMFALLTSAGTSAVIGRLIGERNPREAASIGQRVTAMAPLLGVMVAVPALFATGSIVRLSGLPANVFADARMYLVVLLLGLPISYGLIALHATLVGLGHPRASFAVNLVALSVAFVLTPTFVVVARIGIPGAAMAQVCGEALALAYGHLRLRGHLDPSMRLPLSARVRHLRSLFPVLRVGVPLTADAVLHATVGFALVAYMARFGVEYVAAQGTEERLTQILNLPTEGLAPAAATLVGYYVGRERHDMARRVVWWSLGLMTAFSLLGCLLLVVAPGPIVAFLSDDPAYVGVSTRVLLIAAGTLTFLGARDIADSAFGGLGNTLPPLIIGTLVTSSRFPIALILAGRGHLGGLGVIWAINGTLVVQAIILLTWLYLRFDAYARRVTEKDRAELEELA